MPIPPALCRLAGAEIDILSPTMKSHKYRFKRSKLMY